MRFTPGLVIAGLLIAHSTTADAGLFGGFAKDGRYQRGSAQLCQAVTDKSAAPRCQSASVAELAAVSLNKGALQRGPKAKVEARKSGTAIEVLATEDSSLLFRWDSGNLVADLGDVFLDSSGQWVAIEYSSRFGGRRVDDLIVVRLSKTTASVQVSTPDKTPAPVADAPLARVSPEFLEAMNTGLKWDKKRKFKQAIAAYQAALALDSQAPEALYRLAHAQMAAKDKSAAIATLQSLASGSHPDTGRWRVEARFDKIFKSLRLDPAYRSAVGIDRKAGEKVSAYERLVGLGGRWEQASMPCEQAEVDLDLKRNEASRFDLVIRSRCQGSTETTRLDGSWSVQGNEQLRLHFPNMGSDDEDLMCGLELCSDASGEDCLRCNWDDDEILFRTVRR